MKKLVFALLAVLGVATANAQKNSILLYGNASFTSTTDATKNNQMNWQVNPGVGYQFNNHWTAGIELYWNQGSSKADTADRNSTNNYKAGAFLRYTHSLWSSHFFYYYQLGAGYQGQYSTFGSHPATDKASGAYVNLTPNLGYAFGKGFAAYASIGGIGYNTLKFDGDANATKTFDFTFGNNFSFGVSKNFGCHTAHKHHDANAEMRKVETGDEDGDQPVKKEKHHKEKKEKKHKVEEDPNGL